MGGRERQARAGWGPDMQPSTRTSEPGAELGLTGRRFEMGWKHPTQGQNWAPSAEPHPNNCETCTGWNWAEVG